MEDREHSFSPPTSGLMWTRKELYQWRDRSLFMRVIRCLLYMLGTPLAKSTQCLSELSVLTIMRIITWILWWTQLHRYMQVCVWYKHPSLTSSGHFELSSLCVYMWLDWESRASSLSEPTPFKNQHNCMSCKSWHLNKLGIISAHFIVLVSCRN